MGFWFRGLPLLNPSPLGVGCQEAFFVRILAMDKVLANMIRLQELMRLSGRPKRGKAPQRQVKRLRNKIPGNLLEAFDRLLHHGRTPMAALSESAACGSCHLNLPRFEVLQVRRATGQIFTCPYCGCFLYAAPGSQDTGEKMAA